MNNKTIKTAYYVGTAFLSVLMLMSAIMYWIKAPEMQKEFINLGYPTYIMYVLSVTKVLGVLVLWFSRSIRLREWAYAGFFLDMSLALSAHLITHDNEFMPAIIGLIFWLLSYVGYRKGAIK